MEGMIYKEMLVIHQEYMYMWAACGTPTTPTSWAKGLIVRLIKITKSLWLYRNVHVHEIVTGLHETCIKEELQK